MTQRFSSKFWWEVEWIGFQYCSLKKYKIKTFTENNVTWLFIRTRLLQKNTQFQSWTSTDRHYLPDQWLYWFLDSFTWLLPICSTTIVRRPTCWSKNVSTSTQAQWSQTFVRNHRICVCKSCWIKYINKNNIVLLLYKKKIYKT